MRVNSSRKTLKTACFETLGSSELRDYLAADCGSMTSPDVNAFTDDLFASSQPANSEKVMAVLDSINAKWGRGTLRPGVVPAVPAWSMRRELMSQSFTTRVDQLWRVSAR